MYSGTGNNLSLTLFFGLKLLHLGCEYGDFHFKILFIDFFFLF